VFPKINRQARTESLKGTIKIDGEYCKECLLCTTACKNGNLQPSGELNSKGFHPIVLKDDADCNGCALCALVCPEVAIEVYRGQ